MIRMSVKLDEIDRRILRALQKDATLSQRDLADRVGLSQNACWRRVNRLKDQKVIAGYTVRLDRDAVDLGLTVFVLIRTRQHSADWLKNFRREVSTIPNVIDMFRIAGDYDYILKVQVADMNGFDQVYQRMIASVDLDTVTSLITMEAIAEDRDLPL